MVAETIAMDVVFDIRTADFAAWFVFTPLGILLAALFIELVRRRRAIRGFVASPRDPRMAGFLLASVALVGVTGYQLRAYFAEETSLVHVLNTGQARIVEGEITDYTPQAWTGRPLESFRVGGERFSFDGFGATPAYHKRVRNGGPLREGMRVRLFEFRGNILRVEVLATDRGTAPH